MVDYMAPKFGGIGPRCLRCDRGGEWTDPFWRVVPLTAGFRFGQICHWCDHLPNPGVEFDGEGRFIGLL